MIAILSASVRPTGRLHKQQGMATLMFSLVFLLALTGLALMSAKTLLTEQAISANQYRHIEAGYAAEAALEYGIAWLESNDPAPAHWGAIDEDGDGEHRNDLSADSHRLSSGREQYHLTVDYSRACLDEPIPVDLVHCQRWMITLAGGAVADGDSGLIHRRWLRVLQQPDATDASRTEYLRVPGSWRDW